jgi:TRAP-type mannitol/chloroaromatic compound transport system permease large subunit
MPFIALQLLAIGILFAWPILVTWLPGMAYR